MTENKSNKPIRIIIAEDQPVVRAGLVAIFKQLPNIDVVGEAENGLEAISLYKAHKPQVVLLDLQMPVLDGVSTIEKILAFDPDARILIVTGYGGTDLLEEAINLGASGVTLKDSTYEQFLEAIYTVSRGEEFLPTSIAMRMLRERAKNNDTQSNLSIENQELTRRELDVLRGISEGLSNQEIADKLVLEVRTVAKYSSAVLKKLNLENRTQAAIYALKNGINKSD